MCNGGDGAMLKDKAFWRAVFVEFFGTTLFLFLLTAVLINPTSSFTIAFAIGLAIAILARVFGPISRGHSNPAITVGTMVTGDSGIVKAFFYIAAQLIGGFY